MLFSWNYAGIYRKYAQHLYLPTAKLWQLNPTPYRYFPVLPHFLNVSLLPSTFFSTLFWIMCIMTMMQLYTRINSNAPPWSIWSIVCRLESHSHRSAPNRITKWSRCVLKDHTLLPSASLWIYIFFSSARVLDRIPEFHWQWKKFVMGLQLCKCSASEGS